MGDILSGGAIDQSTSGPIPPKVDDRDSNILLEQREKQNQDSVGGTQFPPKPQPLPPIPQAVEVSPPLPAIPTLDLSSSGLEETREIARQTVIDILKNVTINGQGPSIDGSSISFNFSREPAASEAFVFRGFMVSQPIPEPLSLLPTITLRPPQPQDTPETQPVVTAPPSDGLQPAIPTAQLTIPIAPEAVTTPPLPQPPPTPATPAPPQLPPTITPEAEPQTTTIVQPAAAPTKPAVQAEQQAPEMGNTIIDRIISRIPQNEPVDAREIRSAIREEGFQTSQRGWSNYIDPQVIKDVIEKKEEAKTGAVEKTEEALEVPKGKDIEKVRDYYAGNTPFPPLIEFNVCINGEPRIFLIPAFGPY